MEVDVWKKLVKQSDFFFSVRNLPLVNDSESAEEQTK